MFLIAKKISRFLNIFSPPVLSRAWWGGAGSHWFGGTGSGTEAVMFLWYLGH